MTKRLALIFAATTLASASALAQEQAASPTAPEAGQEASSEKKAFLDSCSARKFETTVAVNVDGQKRGRKMTLCGKEGQTDADWIQTLKDAARKTEANKAMAPAVKEQIVAALNAEIAKFDAGGTVAEEPIVAATVQPESQRDFSALSPVTEGMPDYSSQPPVRDIRSDYSILPALPEPPKSAKPSLAGSASAPAPPPPLKKPRLTIRCLAPGEKGSGSSCDFLEPATRLTIRADEDLGDLTLRFLRKGNDRGEVSLAEMRQGQIVRASLPSQLCTGVATSKVEIQVLGGSSSQVLGRYGPYGLRC